MSAGIQYGVDTTCAFGRLEKDLHAASRPETLHDKEGESFLSFYHESCANCVEVNCICFHYAIFIYTLQFCLVLVIDFSQKLSLHREQTRAIN